MLLRSGITVDAALIPAPPSTKRGRKRDPEMSSTKKGGNYHFGLKARIGVNADSGLVHMVDVTTAKITDGSMTDWLRHGEEEIVLGAIGPTLVMTAIWRRNARPMIPCGPSRSSASKKGEAELPAEQALLNHMLAQLRGQSRQKTAMCGYGGGLFRPSSAAEIVHLFRDSLSS